MTGAYPRNKGANFLCRIGLHRWRIRLVWRPIDCTWGLVAFVLSGVRGQWEEQGAKCVRCGKVSP